MPDAEVNSGFTVPLRLIVLSNWLNSRLKVLPMRVPCIEPFVPQEAAFPVKLAWPVI